MDSAGPWWDKNKVKDDVLIFKKLFCWFLVITFGAVQFEVLRTRETSSGVLLLIGIEDFFRILGLFHEWRHTEHQHGGSNQASKCKICLQFRARIRLVIQQPTEHKYKHALEVGIFREAEVADESCCSKLRQKHEH